VVMQRKRPDLPPDQLEEYERQHQAWAVRFMAHTRARAKKELKAEMEQASGPASVSAGPDLARAPTGPESRPADDPAAAASAPSSAEVEAVAGTRWRRTGARPFLTPEPDTDPVADDDQDQESVLSENRRWS
jgi:hypothetical protein